MADVFHLSPLILVMVGIVMVIRVYRRSSGAD